MLLKLENIGMIKEASVKLDGLTIIAGENDTGKSTVGKSLYFLLKTITNIINTKSYETYIETVNFKIFDIFGKDFNLNEKHNLFLGNYIDKNYNEEVRVIFENLETTINHSSPKDYYKQENDYKLEDRIIALSKLIKNAKTISFIDTPDILTKAKYIKNANFLMSQNNLRFFIPHQVSDLILRLSQDIITNKDNKLYKKISEIIHGEVYYDSDRDDFYFKKENVEKEVNIHNTSNGIKMFGLLQILIANETIKENSILILDEPEVHLHPKWQLKYAEILVELVKSSVIVLVTSHSPYIVEALKVYSDKENLNDKTNFYLAESEDGVSSTIKDVTGDLEPIFEKLSEPFNRLEIEEIDNFKW